jgi:hypothetical protein
MTGKPTFTARRSIPSLSSRWIFHLPRCSLSWEIRRPARRIISGSTRVFGVSNRFKNAHNWGGRDEKPRPLSRTGGVMESTQ